ncbi:hypothetical protein CO661_24175 [Sinorhizobium fredii]|uniref:Transmembrane protein n=1 Tax=Rhizobium fredii TaxID=380 RepID=A0A2A6LT20_RHIFR|nr:hypothetical protein [Sinorhizobium fredii]PDT45362.1 hypothetical protein CO661_24175 [Sinorhizobium fredii]
MKFTSIDLYFLTLGSAIGILAALTSSYPAVIAGYLVLVLGLFLAFTLAYHEGRPYYSVSNAAKLFVGFGTLVWMLAIVFAAVLAVL